MEDDIHNSPSQHDLSNNDEKVPKDSVIIEFDSLDNGGLVAASPSYHVPLYHLLNRLEKDVYYAIDASSSTDESSPSLTLSVKEKYPKMDPASFHAKFKYAMQSKVFTKHATFFVSQKVRNTKWFMVRSKEYVTPSKSPDDQITEFQNGAKHFWPYDTTAAGSSTPYVFKKAPDPTFVQSLKAKRDREKDER